jgi:hypothetical protein
MNNKIKAVFMAIGAIGFLMLGVSAFLWLFAQWPGHVLEFFIIFLFVRFGYGAYKYFLGNFEKDSKNEQINS